MSIAELLRDGLFANSGVSALVSTRIYPLRLPQHPTYPALTYQRISNSGQDGTSNRKESRWQINCWATTHLAAVSLSAAVKAFAEEWHDVSETPSIEWARVVGEYDDEDDEAKVYRTIVDVILITKGD
jgi:hypothetical protein